MAFLSGSQAKVRNRVIVIYLSCIVAPPLLSLQKSQIISKLLYFIVKWVKIEPYEHQKFW